MHSAYATILVFMTSLTAANAIAANTEFSGVWTIDIRTPEERKNKVECGIAVFDLTQNGEKIKGEHSFSTPGCGRLNEGGDGTVMGVIVGSTAVLVVTSGRNGAIVVGKAVIKQKALYWETIDEIKAGEPEGDSPLILGKGTLRRNVDK